VGSGVRFGISRRNFIHGSAKQKSSGLATLALKECRLANMSEPPAGAVAGDHGFPCPKKPLIQVAFVQSFLKQMASL